MRSMTRRLDVVLGLMIFAAAPRSEAKPPEKRAPRALEARGDAAVFLRATFVVAADEEPESPRAVLRATPSGPAMLATQNTCTPRWGSLTHGELDRCIDGDGDGCVTIGDVYHDACDAYSSVKWYRRGCRLGSAGACDALVRLNESVPPPANP